MSHPHHPTGSTAKPTYEHVYGHQDRKKLWWNLTLEAQLNCVCDGLAKETVSHSLLLALPRQEKYLLPMEHAAVFVREEKSTTDVSKEVCYCLGEVEARQFYTATPRKEKGGGLGWYRERFNQVVWESLYSMLEPKPDMYGI